MIRHIFNTSIRNKIILIYLASAIIVSVLNVIVYVNVNRIVYKIDDVFLSNISIGEFSDSLDKVHSRMLGYLNTKSTDDIYGYYEAYQDYQSKVSKLSNEISSLPLKRMEKNIRSISESYLELTESAVDAKRGRNIEKYRSCYEQAERLYDYLKTCINNLNTEYFKTNTADYLKLSASLNYSEFVNAVLLIVVSAISMLFLIIVLNRLVGPLVSLAEVAEKVAEGDYNVRVEPVESTDEIGILNSAFDRMLTGIRHGILMEMRLREAELKTLQAQINPHFLFNTLNAGAQLAMMEGAERTNTYVQAVADFYRYNIKKSDEQVTLAEEIRIVDTYIYILNIRFSGDVGYEKHIEEGLLGVKLPTMTLQPIVENSVNHGIREIMGMGKITISAESEGGFCVVRISDNGRGMSEEEIADVKNRRVGERDEHGGIGLRNVMERLNLMYGEQNVFDIRSDGADMGTTVMIRLPICQDEKKEEKTLVPDNDM